MGMKEQAEQVLGEPVSIATVVSPKGQGRRIMTAGAAMQAAGALGAAAAGMAGSKARSDTPGGFSGGYMVVALTATKLGFFKMKRGLLKNGCGEHLETVERSEIKGWDSSGGALTSGLTVTLADETVWNLEVPRAQKGSAEKIQKELGFA